MGENIHKLQIIMCLKILLAWKTKVDDLNSVCKDPKGHVLPRKMKSLMIANLVSISGFL